MLPTSDVPSTKVELTLSAKNLKDKDLLSKNDPCCVIFQYVQSANQVGCWREVGRTETIMNSLNPEWGTKIRMEYFFEERQKMKFEIYDIDNFKNCNAILHEQDFLGRVECELAEIITANNGTIVFPLKGVKNSSKSRLHVYAEEIDEGQKESLFLHLSGKSLDKKDFLGKSDPFLTIYRLNLDGSQHMVYRTEVKRNTLTPDWMPFKISTRQLCQGDKSRDFLIECYDFDDDGGLLSDVQMEPWHEKHRKQNIVSQNIPYHDFIGNCRANVEALVNRQITTLALWNEKKAAKKGKKYSNSGILYFIEAILQRNYTFLDYIYDGLQLDFTVAVDFTASNGPLYSPASLHFLRKIKSYMIIDNKKNLKMLFVYDTLYEMAIRAVLEICQFYNTTKMFDAYGFGAKIPPAQAVSHLFPLNLSTMNPTVYGVEGVMEAYKICLNNTQLYGPTYFSPTINAVAQKAVEYGRQGDRYQVLLIITDGVITDMESTLMEIIQASHLALSIIVVGVGNEDFEQMKILDTDNQHLSCNGRIASRDIVQFVPFRNFMTSAHTDPRLVQMALAKEVLAEVPDQVVSYMKSKNLAPKIPRNINANQDYVTNHSYVQLDSDRQMDYDRVDTESSQFSSSEDSRKPQNQSQNQMYSNPYENQSIVQPANVNDINVHFQNKMHIDKSSAPSF